MPHTVTAEQVKEKLRTIRDPEIGLDIVTLGLVYHIAIKESQIHVQMTLTTPGCPLTGYFLEHIKEELLSLDHVTKVDVEFLLDPPWNPSMIEKEARLVIGF